MLLAWMFAVAWFGQRFLKKQEELLGYPVTSPEDLKVFKPLDESQAPQPIQESPPLCPETPAPQPPHKAQASQALQRRWPTDLQAPEREEAEEQRQGVNVLFECREVVSSCDGRIGFAFW